jgi:uncharacterized membrane protein YdjX (TVP38/TMEM64 family)
MAAQTFPRYRLTLILALLACLALLFIYREPALFLVREQLRVLDIRVSAVFFIMAFTIGSVLLVPASIMMLIGGYYFGLTWGTLLNLAGFGAGAIVTFLTSKFLVHDLASRYMPGAVFAKMQETHQHGWPLVAVLRMTGIIPAVLINYAMGLTSIRPMTFLWSSVVFTIPSALILTYAGVAGDEFRESGDMSKLLLAVAFIGLMSVAGWFVRKRVMAGQAP